MAIERIDLKKPRLLVKTSQVTQEVIAVEDHYEVSSCKRDGHHKGCRCRYEDILRTTVKQESVYDDEVVLDLQHAYPSDMIVRIPRDEEDECDIELVLSFDCDGVHIYPKQQDLEMKMVTLESGYKGFGIYFGDPEMMAKIKGKIQELNKDHGLGDEANG